MDTTVLARDPARPAPERPDPWLSMWTRPRRTIRHLVDEDPSYGVLALAALTGIAQVLGQASGENLGDHLGLGAILLVAAVVGPVGGIVGLYVFGWLLSVAGRWLGGEAPAAHLRTAVAWGNLPNAAGLLLWLPAFALVGHEMFTYETPELNATPLLALFLLPIMIAWVALGIWSFVLVLLSIAEVQGFSGWRAFGNMLLAALLFALPFFVLGVLAAVFIAVGVDAAL